MDQAWFREVVANIKQQRTGGEEGKKRKKEKEGKKKGERKVGREGGGRKKINIGAMSITN